MKKRFFQITVILLCFFPLLIKAQQIKNKSTPIESKKFYIKDKKDSIIYYYVVSEKFSESTNESIRMSVFPNPTTSDFNIQLKGLTSEDLVTIRVMDLQGRVIKVMNSMPEQNLSIGSDLKAGTYLIEVRQGKNLVIQKVIKY